jgi:hypothetical protein
MFSVRISAPVAETRTVLERKWLPRPVFMSQRDCRHGQILVTDATKTDQPPEWRGGCPPARIIDDDQFPHHIAQPLALSLELIDIRGRDAQFVGDLFHWHLTL